MLGVDILFNLRAPANAILDNLLTLQPAWLSALLSVLVPCHEEPLEREKTTVSKIQGSD